MSQQYDDAAKEKANEILNCINSRVQIKGNNSTTIMACKISNIFMEWFD